MAIGHIQQREKGSLRMEAKPMMESSVRVWSEDVEIPTYGVGEPDKNPMFLDKRVYQGSSGRVYPYPVIDKILDEKKPQRYRLVFLENEYLHIEIMPEIGGRVYRAIDKTTGYDFVYYNQVIKPALVGLAGPWISGGIEFNWPQHHRPNTFGPVEYTTRENTDGSKTVWVSEIDRMYGTKMTEGFTLYPGKAYLEIHVQLYNRTQLPQTFLWWANPALAVNDHTQSIFPPDVHAVFDHGKRDVSDFPIATGTYYKIDYSAGIDISRYKNIPVPTSYMAYHSDYDFVGGYDHALHAGMLHIANHHISPGKKQWTWGNGEFGHAWDRNLTDEDGPYVELMAGAFTDNQPDFSWLQPYEEKSFKQYFLPYKNIGAVKNASIDAAVNLDVDMQNHTTTIQVYATRLFEQAVIELRGKQQVYLHEHTTISPRETYAKSLTVHADEQAHDLMVTIKDALGRILVSYKPAPPQVEEIPDAAKPLPEPEAMRNTEELYLAGLHLEQYRHTTFEPDRYYLEGLKRDPRDIRLNVAYGTLLLRRGALQDSAKYFRTAIASSIRYNPNPYDSEAYYLLGVVLKMQGQLDEAFAAFYKATWSAGCQDKGYFMLAQIACEKKAFAEALELIDRSLIYNSHNYQALHLKIAILRKLNRVAEAWRLVVETRTLDIANSGVYNEEHLLLLAQSDVTKAEEVLNTLNVLMRNDIHNYIALATDYMHAGFYEESRDVLRQVSEEKSDHPSNLYPMVAYYLASLYDKLGDSQAAHKLQNTGMEANLDYCFPNSLDDLLVLEQAVTRNAADARAHYYLGNLLYDKKRYTDAIQHWEASRDLDASLATVHRNLALAYYNIKDAPEQACKALEKAFACNPSDARVLYELDQLYKRLGYTPERRLAFLDSHWEVVQKRDDIYLEYIALLNMQQQYATALTFLETHNFHPWEGGEGKVTSQYVFAHVEFGKKYLATQQRKETIDELQKALHYPENLSEGKLAGTQENNIYYYLGCAYEQLGQREQAREAFQIASHGLDEPTSALFYNDQPPDMIFYQGLALLKLQDNENARKRFHKLIAYGEQHLFDDVKIDYFAVSLPDLLVFKDDLRKRNEIHCHYMMGLGYLGLQNFAQATSHLSLVVKEDPNHQGARVHLNLVANLVE